MLYSVYSHGSNDQYSNKKQNCIALNYFVAGLILDRIHWRAVWITFTAVAIALSSTKIEQSWNSLTTWLAFVS